MDKEPGQKNAGDIVKEEKANETQKPQETSEAVSEEASSEAPQVEQASAPVVDLAQQLADLVTMMKTEFAGIRETLGSLVVDGTATVVDNPEPPEIIGDMLASEAAEEIDVDSLSGDILNLDLDLD